MKKHLIALMILCSGLAMAQKKQDVKDVFWGKNDDYKTAMTIPDKWKNESAVIIYKSENHDYDRQGGKVIYISSVRKRIKLLDQAAISEFSEFSFKERFHTSTGFRWTEGTNSVGIKVIKPDGSEREVNVKEDAVTADDVKKIAIPNLEKGDIIDYYYHSSQACETANSECFEPKENTLGDYYPIMNMKFSLRTEKDFFINFNTYNGAPELTKLTTKGDERKYEFTASDIAKNDFPRWFYPLVELPCYKFQVSFASRNSLAELAQAFLPENDEIVKKAATKEDVLKYYDNKYRPFGDLLFIERFLKGKTFKNNEEKVKAVYYFCRHHYYTRFVEAFVARETNIMEPFELYGGKVIFFNSESEFINHMMAFLKDNKIDYDIITATARHNGSINDLLIQHNVEVILKINTENPVYLKFFTPFSNADQVPYELENTDAFALKISKRKKITDVETIKLPGSTYSDNKIIEKSTVEILPDFEAVKISRESSLTGHTKDSDQDDKMYFFDYVAEDYAKYETKSLMEMVGNKKKKEQYTKEFDALKNKLKDKQIKEFKAAAEAEYGFGVDDHTLTILNTGRFGKADPFSYKEDFLVKNNLLKQAGANYVFEIGKLIGEQVNLDEKEKTRTNNIYTLYPRSFEEEITFTIPEGYAVSGLDKLNKKVENSTGGFVSSASIEGNQLRIKAYKYYANYFEPNANWKNMTAFLDAAYQFTQEKILLKKI